MKFSLNSEKKIEAYQNVLVEYETQLLLRLEIFGMNPEEFDENKFVPREGSTIDADIANLILKIKEIKQKIEEISQ